MTSAWWQALSWPRRAAVVAALTAAGWLDWLAWLLSPAVAVMSYVTIGAVVAAGAGVRAVARRGS